jgi:hypothetical protein
VVAWSVVVVLVMAVTSWVVQNGGRFERRTDTKMCNLTERC